MYLNWKTEKKERTIWTAFFFAGFLAGIAAVCLLPDVLVRGTGFLDAGALSRIRCLEINKNALLLYSLRQRLGTAVLLILLAAAGFGRAGSCLLSVWAGLSAGGVLTALSMRCGIKGLLLFLGAVLPQVGLLIPGYLMLLDWCVRKRERRKLLLSLAILITGCILESYVNPLFLKAVLCFLP